jgi:hypothetical protein
MRQRIVGLRQEISESAIQFIEANRRRGIGDVLRSWLPQPSSSVGNRMRRG